MKLSEKQKEVVAAMRKGMSLASVNVMGCYVSTNTQMDVSSATLKSLRHKELIEVLDKSDWRKTAYQLTELGKTIEL